jgi:hypothetical protein
MISRSLLSVQLGCKYRDLAIVNPFQEANQAAALFNFVRVSKYLGPSDSLRAGGPGIESRKRKDLFLSGPDRP